MKILIPGHKYELQNYDNPGHPGQVIQFIHKVPLVEGHPELTTVSDGTTNEEVMAVLIDRLTVMNQKLPSRETSIQITKIEEALMWANKRTAERKARGVEGTMAK